MGKKGKHRKAQAQLRCPSWDIPVCPTCGKPDQIVDETLEKGDDPMMECMRCQVRFMYESTRGENEDDDDTATAQANIARAAVQQVGGASRAATSGPTRTEEPVLGEMEELRASVT